MLTQIRPILWQLELFRQNLDKWDVCYALNQICRRRCTGSPSAQVKKMFPRDYVTCSLSSFKYKSCWS
ncbi:hypothetical protein GDO78_003827 [Eleutherodactylus coqui]|uniref:Uncharacterized protein n=1 Tax=Eleutherodactylus coqui TaxID=57060 RepID=A0A8J6EV34_ELECQ|nr:hypothetical protein GDO78_003827 [Eleutherodactylus coqui]